MKPPKSPAPKSVKSSASKRSFQPGLAARLVAAETYRRCLKEHRSIEDALALVLQHSVAGAGLPAQDQGLARAIVMTTFRRLGTIRAALAERLRDGTSPDAGRLEEAMVIGAAQILFMDVPDHSAVDLAVETAKSERLAMHYAPLVNAVLRKIAAEKADILAKSDAFALDLPPWLRERWCRFHGEPATRAMAQAMRQESHIDLTPMIDVAALQARLGGTILPTGSLRLETSDDIATLDGYAEGAFLVQDAASALPAKLLTITPGALVLDLCAAPGGKTAQLAKAGGTVVAVERSAQRIARLEENLARLKLEAEIVVGDAGTFTRTGFDAILLDAPCSATGTMRRHPEIGWTKRLDDILALARQQDRLLHHAVTLLKPGGVLVYATCSLENEEGERQIERLLEARKDIKRLPILAGEAGIPAEMISPMGDLRVLPAHFAEFGGVDGFYAARLQVGA